MVVMSLGEFLWSLLVIFFMVIYFMMLFQVIVDVFRRNDASGWTKAAWLVFLFLAPFLGLIAYLVTNSQAMAERNVALVERRGGYTSTPPAGGGGGGAAAEISQAKQLLDSGAITPEEYSQIKSKALA